jgi:hypothetical protein
MGDNTVQAALKRCESEALFAEEIGLAHQSWLYFGVHGIAAAAACSFLALA